MHSPIYQFSSPTGRRCFASCRRLACVPQPPAVSQPPLASPACSSTSPTVQPGTLWTCQPGRPGPGLARPLLAPPRLQPPQAISSRPRGGRDGSDSSAASPAPPPSRSRPPRQRKADADSGSPSPAARGERRPRTPQKPRQQRPQRSRTPSPPPPPPAASAGDGGGGGPPVRVDQELELECVRLALEGKGVCLLPPTGFVVLVERALPGEVLRARVVSVKRGYAEARKLATLSPHKNAVPAPCPYFGPCGGCTLQSLQYEAQLAEKRNQVEQTLRRVGRLGPALDAVAAAAGGDGGSSGGVGGVAAVVGCSETFAYRNKMMFHFSSTCFKQPDIEEADRPCLGLLKPGTAHVVLPVVRAEPSGCMLQGPLANQLAMRAEELCWDTGLLPHNHPSGTGQLRHLTVRSGGGMRGTAAAGSSAGGREGEEYMLVFGITRDSAIQPLRLVAQELGREFPQLASVVAQYVREDTGPKRIPRDGSGSGSLGAAGGPAPQQRQGGGRDRGDRRGGGRGPREAEPAAGPADGGEEEEEDGGISSSNRPMELLYGKPYIHDVLCGLTFRISPGSFFQTNSRQTEVLYDIVRQAAALRPGAVDTVLDLYCGTGTIGLSLAKDCKRVIGVDVVESAMEDARLNAAINGVTNAAFVCADVDALDPARLLTTDSDVPVQPDVVVVDPARAGLSLGAAAFLSRCGARRVVYVSCNVATQARDLDRLVNGPAAPFRLVSVRPVDMFPHTDHVETVAVLERRDGGGDAPAAVA